MKRKTLIKGITFDLEGTIINLEKYHRRAHLLAAAEHGIRLTSSTGIKQIPNFIGGPDRVVAEQIAKISNGAVNADEIFNSKQRFFQTLVSSINRIEPRTGFRTAFKWLQASCGNFAIGTVTEKAFALYLLEKTKLLNEFDLKNIVSLEDVSATKPAPDIYILTAHRLGIESKEQLIFEDSLVGAKAALAAGSKVIIIPTLRNQFLIRSFEKLPDSKIVFSWNLRQIKNTVNILCAT
jgi:beta-phosphoglucomutase